MFKEVLKLGRLVILLSLCSYGEIEKNVPLLEYLPNGTALTNVTIPSYDEFRKPTSIFKADEVVIVNKDEGIMEAQNVNLKVLSSDDPYTIELEKARFFYQKSYLEAEQRTMIHNNSVTISGTGACYDLTSKEVFIKGPVKALLTPKEVAKNLMLGIFSTVALLPAQAAPPEAPTTRQLTVLSQPSKHTPSIVVPNEEEIKEKRESLSQSREKMLSEQSGQRERLEAVEEKKRASSLKLSSFLEKTGQADLLIQNEGEGAGNAEGKPLIAPDGALTITCDDGMYYDAEEGLMVCLKNVKVKEPRFDLSCSDQLKVFLTSEKKADKDEEMGFGSADLKELIATGNVVIYYKDTGEQPPVKLTGESAFFDAKTEEITMTGGMPTMQQGRNFVETLEPTWLKISKKGVRFGPGKKRTVYLPENE